jgi:hypothetical protein
LLAVPHNADADADAENHPGEWADFSVAHSIAAPTTRNGRDGMKMTGLQPDLADVDSQHGRRLGQPPVQLPLRPRAGNDVP